MKNFLGFFLMLLFFFSSCTVNKLPRFDYINGSNPWIDAFKDRVFVNCLKHSYNNDSVFIIINKKDVYINPYDGFYDYLEADKIKFLDSLGNSIPLHIPPPTGLVEGVGARNFYMCNCLHYYASRELDSIAKKEYKKHIKAMKK